jgi:hypothetical protein
VFRTHLLEEREPVGHRPVLDELAPGDPVNHDPGHRDLLAVRGNAQNLAFEGSRRRQAGHDLVPFRDLILDRVARVGEGRVEHHAGLLDALTAGCRAGERRVVVDVVGRHELVGDVEVPLVHLGDPAANEDLVLLRHGGPDSATPGRATSAVPCRFTFRGG